MSDKRKILIFKENQIGQRGDCEFRARDTGMDYFFTADLKAMTALLDKYEFELMMIDNSIANDSDRFREIMTGASERHLPVVVTRIDGSVADHAQAKSEQTESLIKKLVLRRRQFESAIDHREKLNIVSETAATLSHEINNPLMAITANIEMLLRKKRQLDPDISEKISAIKHAAERIRKVTHKLTDLDALKFRQTAAGRMIEIDESIDRKVLHHTEKAEKID